MKTQLQALSLLLSTGNPTMVRAPRSGRGATFIEYMLLAAIAVLLFVAIYAGLNGAFGNILNSVRDALNIN